MTDTNQTLRDNAEPLRGGIDIYRYGEVMAHVRHFGKNHTPEVLERLGLDEDRWEQALFGFTALMVEESEREEEALSRQFGERFAKTKTKLVKEKPALASLGPLRNEKRDETPPAKAVELPAPLPIAPIPAPAPLPAREAAPTVAAPNPPSAQIAVGGSSPWANSSGAPMIAPPRMVAEPAREQPAFVLPAGMRNFQGIQGTQAPSVRASTQPAMPFANNPAVAEPEAAYRRAKEIADATEPVRPETSSTALVGGETRDISSVIASVVAQSKATPFDKRKPAVPAPVGAPAVVKASPPAPVGAPADVKASPPAPVGAPAVVKASPPAPVGAPAVVKASPPAPVGAPAVVKASPPAPVGAPAVVKASPPAPVGAPAVVKASPLAPVAAPAPAPSPTWTPVTASAPSPAPAPIALEQIPLTLEQYASLCVEVALAPAKQREITERYGLSEEQAGRVDAHWRGRIASDPEIDKSFRWAYHSYQQWLAGRS